MSKTHLVNLLLDAMDELVSKDEIDDAIEQMEAASARTREGAPSGGVTGWGEDPLFELFLRNISHALREAFEELGSDSRPRWVRWCAQKCDVCTR